MNSARSFSDSVRAIWRVLSYGRFVVLSCFGVMFLLYGAVLNTFTIFLDPLVEDLGSTRGGISFAMMIGALGMGIAAPISGKLMDRLGARPVMIVGALMIGFGILIASMATALWQIYILYAFVGCGLAGATVIPCSLIISNWFASRRGTAMGIMAMGTSVGGMCMTPVANWIIQNHGWRAAYAFSGTVILTLGLSLIVFLLRPSPSEAGFEPYVDPDAEVDAGETGWGLTVAEAFSTTAFWQIAALMFIIGLVTSGLGTHIAPCLTDFGHTPTRAAYAWTITLGVMTVAKFLFGPIADRWGPKSAMTAACALMAVSVATLTLATSYSVVVLFALLYGFGVGAPLTVNPLLVGETLGVRHFGAVFGVLNLISIIGAAIGPVALGLASDAHGTYVPTLYVFVGLMALTGVIAAFINAAPQRSDEILAAQSADAAD